MTSFRRYAIGSFLIINPFAMPSQLLTYVNLVLCVAVFLELLYRFRQQAFLKLCFLLIIVSLFTMNYFTYVGVATRFEVVLVKAMRVVYVCSTMAAVIHLVSGRIPRSIIAFMVLAGCTVIGIRLFYFNQIDIESLVQMPNQVFTVGAELYQPKIALRLIVYLLVLVTTGVAFWHYRRLLAKLDWELPQSQHLLWWIGIFIAPFFLLIIFGMLGSLGIMDSEMCGYLFSSFNCLIIVAILLRPRSMHRHIVDR